MLAPPLAEVEKFEQAIAGVSELALVNDESSFKLGRETTAGMILSNENDDGFNLGSEELKSEVCRREGAGARRRGFSLSWGTEKLAGWRRSSGRP